MPTSLRELQSILDFEESDLVANRKGKLSKAQVEWLHAKARQELQMLLAIPVLVVAWLMMTIPFVLAFPTVLLIGVMMAGFIALHKHHIKSIVDHPVQKLSGQLRKHLDGPRPSISSYVITINNQPLPVDRYFFEQISEGKFTIYLYDKHILCMEPLKIPSTTSTASKPKTATKPKAKTAASRTSTSAKKSTTAKASTTKSGGTTKPKAAPAKKPTAAKAVAAPKAEKRAKATGKAPQQSLQRTRRSS